MTVTPQLPITATKIFTNSDGDEHYQEETFMTFAEANEWVCAGMGDVDPFGRQQTDYVITQTFIVEVFARR